MKLLEEVEALGGEKLLEYIRERALLIVKRTQGESWDDPEEYQGEAVELAHGVWKYLTAGGK